MTDNTTPDNNQRKKVNKVRKNFIDHERLLTRLPTDPMLIRHVRSTKDDTERITLVVNFDFDPRNIRVNTSEDKAKPTSTYKDHYYTKAYHFSLGNVESETTEGKFHGRWVGSNVKIVGLPDNEAVLARLNKVLDKYSELDEATALKVIKWLSVVEDSDNRDMAKRRDRIDRGAKALQKHFDGNFAKARRFVLIMDNLANRIPDYLDKILAKASEGTMVTVTTKGMFILKFFNEDGSVRELGDLRAFEVEMAKKAMKRHAPMATQSYNYDSWDNVRVFKEIDSVIYQYNMETGELTDTTGWDEAEFRNIDGVINILFATGPKDRTLVDGVSIMAPHILDKMVADYAAREEDEERREEYVAKFLGCFRYNVRLVIPIGTIKGDVVIAKPEMAMFDFVTWEEENLKPGLRTRDGRAHMHMTPQNEYHSVRANTQSVAHFGNILNVDDTLIHNMTALRQRDARNVMAGKAVGAVKHVRLNTLEDSTLRNVMERIAIWLDNEGTLNTSPHLTLMNANQVVRMGDVDKEHKLIRQYPTSYSVSMSVTSEYIYTLATGEVLGLEGTEFVLTKYGAIFSDDEFEAIMEALGGADQDDHAEFHFRRMIDSVKMFDIWAGSIAALVIRNPIGTNSDGKKVSSEYYVMRPRMSHDETAEFVHKFRELPEMSRRDLPTHSSKLSKTYLDTCKKNSTPHEPSYPHGYSMETFETMVYDTARAVGLYGTINLLMTFCRQHNIKFELGLEPEFLIDVCEQTRDPRDLAVIKDKVKYMRKVVRAAVVRGKLPVDPVAWDRLGLMGEFVADPTKLITAMVEHYRYEMEKYIANARLHLGTIKDHWMEAYRNSDDKDDLKAEFFLMRSIVGAGFTTLAQGHTGREAIDKVSNQMGTVISKAERENPAFVDKYNEVLSNVYRSFTDKEHKRDDIFPDKKFTVRMFNESRSDSPIAVYANTDQVFVATPMIRRYLKALETNRELRLAFLPENDIIEWDEEVLVRGFDPETFFEADDDDDTIEDADGGIEA